MPERRGWRLAGGLVAVAAASFALYRLAPPAVAEWAIAPYALALVLGPAIAYAATRSVAAGLALPLLWLAKEMWRVSRVFGPGETLFYALNPLSAGLFAFAALQMAAVELARRRRWAWGPGAVVIGFAALAAAAFCVGRESGGRELFYGYIALYRRLFSE